MSSSLFALFIIFLKKLKIALFLFYLMISIKVSYSISLNIYCVLRPYLSGHYTLLIYDCRIVYYATFGYELKTRHLEGSRSHAPRGNACGNALHSVTQSIETSLCGVCPVLNGSLTFYSKNSPYLRIFLQLR